MIALVGGNRLNLMIRHIFNLQDFYIEFYMRKRLGYIARKREMPRQV